MYPLEAILGLYQAINPAVENLAQALLWFNCPFTLFKALCDVAITFFGLQENFPPHPRKGGLKRRCRLYFLTPSLPYSIL